LVLLQDGQKGESMMKTRQYSLKASSPWQLIFLQSKVNGALYDGQQLLGSSWDCPKNTYLQPRRD
jgi:hypothetical protein